MNFIFATDGTAINVDHIVTIFVQRMDKPEGYMVRCRSTLSHPEYAAAGAQLNLSPTFPQKETAQAFLDAIVQDILNPAAESPQ